MKRVLVFGVFDGLHPGHDAMLKEARALGDELYVAVAQDAIVQKLKNKLPRQTLHDRIAALNKHECVTKAVPGDEEVGTWKILSILKPQVVACGYDQVKLLEHLKLFVLEHGLSIEMKQLSPYEAERYHSSLLQSSL